MIITSDSITHVSSDQSKLLPYSVATDFPVMCHQQYMNCQPFLSQHETSSNQFVTPRYGPVKHFHFENDTFEESSVLTIKNCMTFFLTGKPSETGAICVQNTTEELLVALYKIQYHDQNKPRAFLQVDGKHIELDNSLLITNDTDGKPVALYITYCSHMEENCLVILQWSSNNPLFISLPPTCRIGPYELKSLGQYNVLIKCSSEKLMLYNGDDLTLTELFDDISMVESCVGKASFVAVQGTNILLNNTKSIMQIPVFSIKFHSNVLQQISSIACHFNGDVTILYFTTTWSGYIYYLSVALEHVVHSNTAVEATEIRPAEQFNPFQTVYSTVVGPAWASILHNKDNDKRKLILTDMHTGKTGSYLANGLIYVMPYSNDFYEPTTPAKQLVTPSHARSYNVKKWAMPVGITAAILTTLVGIFLSILIVYRNCKKPALSHNYRTLSYGDEPLPVTSNQFQMENIGPVTELESSQSPAAPMTTLVESEIGNQSIDQSINDADHPTDNIPSPVQTSETIIPTNVTPITASTNTLHSSLFGSSQIFEPAAEESTSGTPQHSQAVVGSHLLLASTNTHAVPDLPQNGDDGDDSETES